jgi:integrase
VARAAALKAPMPRWTIHGIRHTVATHMREDLKIQREVVSLVLGHTLAGPTATRIYDRSEMLPERRAALTAWADWLRALQATGAP